MEQLMHFAQVALGYLRLILMTYVIDVTVMSFIIYKLIGLVRRTSSGQVAKGVLLLLAALLAAQFFHFKTLYFFISQMVEWGVLALIILFQPEIRKVLEQVGRTDKWAAGLFHSRRTDPSLRGKWQNACLAICDAAEQLSDTNTGALIVLERGSNLSEIIRTGTAINADVNPEILGTIFYEGTPLHDGAVVVRDGTLKAAGCVLPLSDNLEIGKDMGTRHRAALGMSENSDAVVVVVSEETGIISMAKNGVLIRRLDRQNLFNLLQEELVPPEEKEPKKALFWRGKHEKKKD